MKYTMEQRLDIAKRVLTWNVISVHCEARLLVTE